MVLNPRIAREHPAGSVNRRFCFLVNKKKAADRMCKGSLFLSLPLHDNDSIRAVISSLTEAD